jgi:trimeric autotransporter adhesin
MGLDGRAQHARACSDRRRGIRHTWHSCSRQPARTQVGRCHLDRQEGEFLATFTVSGTTVSVSPGATSGNTSTVTITPAGGFTGSVTLTAAVTSSPSDAVSPPTFSFNSTSPVSITGNAAGAAVLAVVTASSVSSNCAASNQRRGETVWYAESAVALTGLFLFVTPKRSRRWRSTLGLVFSFIVLAGIVGCSGAGAGAGAGACSSISTPGTTAGAYVITVTATSGALTEKTTVNVIVQ